MRQNSQKSWEFGYYRKISRILLRVCNVNYPLHFASTNVCYVYRYLPSWKQPASTTCVVTGLQRLLEVETSGKNEQELDIYDPVGLPGSHSLFKVWSDCFLALLFVWRLCSPSKATESCFWQIFYSVSVFVLDIRRIRR